MQPAFAEEVAEALKVLGYGNRSDFIRDAIVEKLRREGYEVDAAIAAAPSRIGKGGRPTHRGKLKFPLMGGSPMLNDAVNSADGQAKRDDLAEIAGAPGAGGHVAPGVPPTAKSVSGSDAGSVSYRKGSKRKPRKPHTGGKS